MKKFLLIIGIILVISIAGCLEREDPYSKFYAGEYRGFRGNLLEAANITIYPNEKAVKDVLLNPFVNKVYIAYISNETENSFYFVSTFEVVNKLSIIYRHLFQGDREVDVYTTSEKVTCLTFYLRNVPESVTEKCFESLAINSTSEAFDIANEKEPVVLLLGPSQTNQTFVTVRGFVITAEGSDFSKVNRTYTDLDLAVDKIILTLMED